MKTWNKPTLHQQFNALNRDVRDELTDFLFARFILIEYADGYVDTQPLLIALKRAVQLFINPEKMGMTVTAECPMCETRFQMAPEDPIYICPNCAHELDRCDWLADMVFDYMKREILNALIEEEPAKADDLLKKADKIPDRHFTDAIVANFKFSFLENLRSNGISVSDELFGRNRDRAVALSWAGLCETFRNITEDASPSDAEDSVADDRPTSKHAHRAVRHEEDGDEPGKQ